MRLSLSLKRIDLLFLLFLTLGSLLILTSVSSLSTNSTLVVAQNGTLTSLTSSSSTTSTATSKVKRSSPPLSELEKESFAEEDEEEEEDVVDDNDDDDEGDDDDDHDDDSEIEEKRGNRASKRRSAKPIDHDDEDDDNEDDEENDDHSYGKRNGRPLKRTSSKTSKKRYTKANKRPNVSSAKNNNRKSGLKASKSAKGASKRKFESDDDDDDDEDDEDIDDNDDNDDDENDEEETERYSSSKSRKSKAKKSSPQKKKKSQKKEPLFDAQLKFTSNELCSDIRCQPNEYCFVPSPGIAECLQKPIYARTPPKLPLKKASHFSSSFTLDNDGDQTEDDDGDSDNDDDEEDEANVEAELMAEKRKNKKNNNNSKKSSSSPFQGSRTLLRRTSATSIKGKPITDDEDYEEEKEEEDEDDEDNDDEAEIKSNSRKKSSSLSNSHKTSSLQQFPSETKAKSFNSSKVHMCPPCPSTNSEYGHSSKFSHQNHQNQVICGSDNASYSSSCRLDFHNCVHGTEVRFACFGFCPCLRVYEKVFIKPKNIGENSRKNFQRQAALFHSVPHPTYSPLKKSIYNKGSSSSSSSAEKIRIKAKKGTANEVLQRKELEKMHYTISDKIGSGSTKECSMEQLRSMGLRLLDWFAVVMKEELKHGNSSKSSANNSKNRRSPNLSPKSNNTTSNFFKKSSSSSTAEHSCEPPVGFMFGHFDADADGRLSLKELYYLEHDENEHCLEPYLNGCDQDGDAYLGAGEWCDCFSLKTKPCLYHLKHLQKELATTATERPLLGAYMPQCTAAGHYEKVQCNRATNWCWCADKNGNEVAGTRVRGRTAKCDKTYPLVKNRQYQQQQQQKQQKSSFKSSALPNNNKSSNRPKSFQTSNSKQKQTNSKNGKKSQFHPPPPSPPSSSPPEDLDLEDGDDDDDAGGEELRESGFTSNLDGGSGSSSLDLY